MRVCAALLAATLLPSAAAWLDDGAVCHICDQPGSAATRAAFTGQTQVDRAPARPLSEPPAPGPHPSDGSVLPFQPDTVVRIDVLAFDARGRFVDNLKAADFEVREDGVVQTLDAVGLMRTPTADLVPATAVDREIDLDEQAEARRPGSRLFAIYLDEYHVSAKDAERVRDAVIRFLDGLGPRDLVVVMKPLDSVLAIRLTHDLASARDAVASFAPRKGDYEPRNAYEKNYMATLPGAIEQMRAQVTLSALNALAVHLGWISADARKSLIVVTEGFGRGMRYRGMSLPTLDSVGRSANRYNVAVYPIDPTTPADD
jgi:VWFA-related protein